jgi:hypothetical protein
VGGEGLARKTRDKRASKER